jgi:hypothetical protein
MAAALSDIADRAQHVDLTHADYRTGAEVVARAALTGRRYETSASAVENIDGVTSGLRKGTAEPSGAGGPPTVEPFMLRGLGWGEALNAMKATGCAVRRNHWCAPIVRLIDGKPHFDDEGEIVEPFTPTVADRRSKDWQMIANPPPTTPYDMEDEAMRYVQRWDDKPFEVRSDEVTRWACCDCGLVHDIAFVALGDVIGVAARVNRRATAARRRCHNTPPTGA